MKIESVIEEFEFCTW